MKLPKTYEPGQYEADIYALWEKNGAFVPKDRGGEGYFSLAMPPPNANANLHIGFGLTVAIQDTIVRYHRLKGQETLYIPGADHAGFETQVVYEKNLSTENKSRFDFTREELYKQIWEFVELNKHNFQSQIRALGASCDWSRFTYSLDNKVVARSYETFKKMWHDELIYRGVRIVNYCTFHGTSFSDIEVVHREEKTKLWHIAYPLADGSGEVVIATTRPETKLGQSALMVNPKDERYKHLIGKEVLQPLLPGKPIKIIADDHVDMKFGTGVVTVTPGHDPDDFEVAKRYNLPIIELITIEGKMSDNVPEKFRGLTVMEARKAVEAELKKVGYLRAVEDHVHSVGKCYKCGTVIEPLARDQWFVSMEPLAKEAIKALEDKKIEFYPDSKRQQLIGYLQGLKDWNISRQIAWGIPIPAFQNVEDPSDWVFDNRVDQETLERDGKKYRRDPDVFDTWFSSAHWPLVSLNFPDGEDFKGFYPLSLMETAGEILHQWVARMIMLGLYLSPKVPFKDVYIHGLVLADGGAKMSKSLGNVVDVMETIATHGSDALRMGLLAGRAPAVNRGYDSRRVEEARNFSNKLWNVARFTEDKVGDDHSLRAQSVSKTPADHWILNQLSIATGQMSKYLDNYRLSEAYETLYNFVWHDLADWYVEVSKTDLNTGLLAYVFESALKLAHPFAPFVTEAIWQTLAWEDGNMLIIQKWPGVVSYDMAKAIQFDRVREVATEARRIINVLGVKKPNLYYRAAPVVAEQINLITKLANLGAVTEVNEPPGEGLKLTGVNYDVWLDVDRQTAYTYLDKLKTRQKGQEEAIARLQSRLDSKDYVHKAPKDLIDQTKSQLETEKVQLAKIEEDISAFTKAASD